MYTVYIIQSRALGSYYIGSTSNVDRRLREHNAEGTVRYTRAGRPWKLVYTEQYRTLSAARRREKTIKSWKKRKRIEALFNHHKE